MRPSSRLDLVAFTFEGTRKGVRTVHHPSGDRSDLHERHIEAATTVYGQVILTMAVRQPMRWLPVVRNWFVRIRAGIFNWKECRWDAPSLARVWSATLPPESIFPGSAPPPHVIAGAANYVVVKLRPAGRIFGRVFDAQGNIVRNMRVAIP